MKIRVQIDESIEEDEIIIRSRVLDAEIQRLHEQIQLLQQSTLRHMIGTDEDRQYVLDVKDISYFETQGDYVYAVQGRKQYRLSFRLYELEQQLPQDRFMRISKSVILNIGNIAHIEPTLGTPFLAKLRDGAESVYISRQYIKALRHKIMGG
ncbi:LytTR family DNA-binding domain-containing protein [Paenibacillus sp.]|uniref:LytTR family DNA-binding domain-containing protein n=1 Tax=Paenibacillus sp. TaxID=58172 RepID=UPI003464343A